MGAGAIPYLLASAVIASAGASTYQGVQANQDKQAAKGKANEMDTKSKELQREAREQMEGEEAQETAATERAQSRARQRAKVGQAQGRQGTLLTGPLGLVTQAEAAQKTLLGQ